MMWLLTPSGVSKASNADIPLLGAALSVLVRLVEAQRRAQPRMAWCHDNLRFAAHTIRMRCMYVNPEHAVEGE
jgi:hypothetical protein